ncbi:SusC/RagA family TonB-linked outer membrane protein [Flagellimonas marinaquae]|uniref:SusC/RagA family TonB-linked outer membrane protein n=1 Tax=Flagellimonas aurea TaxID=2915619 RepID=A0ABS3G7I5_9FLAO|nr:SusC/RagA family TonB-linked outer membrane protein [Allomuricauda aurea]MAO15664.1 SusC/RagA family TonB-linked outer membrane protein [Allomuricauda sp.]MBC71720.1 SusC/RagA family TonB-linked outer membrane protein [Allomuricauda sp.]MBO0355387.1 SusC/RagA family TonB-linked outer membrane protein [Allomuricauda aurea]UBZ15265.1 SusC/RagA family TonB-linked outer membrane protein [Allomuricauda aquimarina]|tara:strand:+ start:8292 stop:11534 length:3243 start_codon:yes stop_codon:yes gene_type:complete
MKVKKLFGALLAICLSIAFAHAQEKTVTGTVTDQDGVPLPGVNIVVKGTVKGTQSDFDGNYAIEANEGDVLVFSYLGQRTLERSVGAASVLNVQMEEDASQLEEVVVTAQGIVREKRSLGYSVTTVESDKVESRPEADVARVLNGKVAGVNITSNNGMSGSGTNIIIRGYSSATQSNQPLFIVDGIPFDSGTNTQTNFLDGNTESSRFLDLDPNNIESVSVLKGLSATVLYGNRGRNGVILITTKGSASGDAPSKTEVSVTQSVFMSNAVLPKFQNNYGSGFHQGFGFFFSNWGPRFDRTDDDGIATAAQYIRTGPNGVALTRHPFNYIADPTLIAGYEDLLSVEYPYQPYNGVEEFFRTGYVYSTSVNVRGGSEKVNFNANYGRTEDIGVTPGNKLLRNNFSLGGNAVLSNNFTVSGVFNFARTGYKSPPNAVSTGSGAAFNGSAIFGDVLYTPRNIDLTNLPFQAADGRSLYYRSGNDIQNPYWTVANSKTSQETDRFTGNVSMSYALNDWMNLTYRVGLDTYTELNSYGQNRGGVDGPTLGILRTSSVRNSIWNHDLILSAEKNLSEDLNLTATLGANSRRDTYAQDGIESQGQLVFGVLEHYNFTTPSSINSFSGTDLNQNFEENLVGIYLDATLSYKDLLYLNVVGRNDWSSTLERENNSLFYPGASLSFIPTTAFPALQGDVLNYAKLRVGYGSSAGFPTPFNTRDVLTLNSRTFVDLNGNVVSGNTVSDVLGNRDLSPERVQELEVGLDTRLFNRLNFNVSLYQKSTTDLITNRTLDSSTGFRSTFVNIGEVETKGIEADYDLTILRESEAGIGFNLAGNFTASETTVTDLAEGTNNILLTFAVAGEAANYAVEGRPFGVLLGSTIQRDDNGNKVVGPNGRYLVDNNITEIGDPNPDWTTAMIPTISFKNFTLSANLQYRHGGDVYSVTTAGLIGRGVVDPDNPIDRESNYILPGVFADGSPNNVAITATEFGFNTFFGGDINEVNVFDGTTIRLQEASLGYSIPKKMLEKTPFGSLSLTLSGSNLWYKAVNFPDDVRYDTNSSSTGVGNGQGIDFFTGPSTRRYGLTVRASF